MTGWRNPGSYCRQLQNTILLKHFPDVVADSFLSLPKNCLTVRLYVDGDFGDVDIVAFWMRLIAMRPEISVYGYSKSWAQLLEYDRRVSGSWPNNYVLNISNGSKYDKEPKMSKAISELPISRGRFVAVKIETKGLAKGFARYSQPEYHKRVLTAARATYGKRVASCPGDCDSCGGKREHWCGDKKLVDLTIAIGVH